MINSSNLTFQCFCNQKIIIHTEQQLKDHIKYCTHYRNGSPISKIFFGIPLKDLQTGQLLSIKQEFHIYLDYIEEQLSKRDNLPPSMDIQIMNSINLNQQNDYGQSTVRYDLQFLGTQIRCPKCDKNYYDFDVDKFWYMVTCYHFFCRACLVKNIKENFVQYHGQLKCLMNGCNELFQQQDYSDLIGDQKYDELMNKSIKNQYNIVSCCKCNQQMEFIIGSTEKNMKDDHGKLLSKEACIHYSECRFICPNSSCKTEQCRKCKSVPYHKGFTCETWQKHQKSKKCRYCDEVIHNFSQSQHLAALSDICSQQECQQKSKLACQKMKSCGHPCCGYKDEQQCLDCLFEECASENKQQLKEQSGEDYCNICFVEGLMQAPSVMLKCGHIFHYHCMEKRLQIRWHRPRITFNFCMCPLCKIWVQFPEGCPLEQHMQDNTKLIQIIQKMSMERLKHEERDKDERLKKIGDPYYQKPLEYAIAIYSYYMCFKCKNPYFGGLKSCENMMEEERGGKEGFDPKELVCANCCEVPIEDCKTHGKTYIEFKCKFCCSIAQWFCWGTTHFCDPCHKRQCKGDYVSKYSRDKLPKCKGKELCPIGGDHKPNGEECALGCALCRNIKQNFRSF